MPTPKREEKYEFAVVNVGLKHRDEPNRTKWRIPDINNVAPIDIVRNRPETAKHLLMTDSEYFISTIDKPYGGTMFLWDKPSQEDAIECEWIMQQIEKGKQIGYKKPKGTKGKRPDNSVDTKSNK